MEQPPSESASEQQAVDAIQQPAVQRYGDDFMMYVFKVEMCKRVDKHDREKCPYAHPGELARRRHPSLYKALPCPEARAKICPRLENCNCSHSTFEFWLHPDRFKTFLCQRGAECNRPICFFAHSKHELRELPQGLQRPRSPRQASASPHSSVAAGAGSSRQAAAVPQAQAGPAMVLVPAGSSGGHITYAAQQEASGHARQQQQLQPEGLEQGSQVVMGYVPVIQQQAAPLLQQDVQYMAVPVQQRGGTSSGAGLGGDAAGGGPQGTQMQLMQQGQVLYAAAGDGPGAGVHADPSGRQQQLHLPCAPHPSQQLAYGVQPALHGTAGQYAAEYVPGGRQQVMIGYQSVQMGGMQGGSGPQGVLMVRPAPQRGATVAVIPAGPSAWSTGVMSAESGEAPSLEALCAAMNHMAVPTNDLQPELLLQQYQQQAMPVQQQQQQQQMLSASHMQAAVVDAAGQLPQGVQVYSAGAQSVPQVLAAAPGQQQQQPGQLLPGQQVMVFMPHQGTPVQGSQANWGGMGSMQPGN
ncbi:hypothetical protein COO60DRAFT_765036 [Scenedesmus sp. NREL 46B-D3]|nr:hypothetical protein COO60DRAFT_765036 [Scenedesmus sp. NREL 46B-D3]